MSFIKSFIKTESAGGIILFTAALALVIKNSPLSVSYDFLLATEIPHWVNDGLMSVFFFFLVGLEIKREFVSGELSTKETALLPVFAALGGMIFPAIVFLIINHDNPLVSRGWAIPCATDIAFSLGILALLGSKVKPALKIFLTALAIIDDLGAIVIIALFYTASLSAEYLLYAAGICLLMFLLNRKAVSLIPIYLICALALWYFVLKSGIHATIAGVLAALFIPNKLGNRSPLKELEHAIHPYVVFGILPIFAFFNAGVSLEGIGPDILFSKLTLGIMLGLFIGKQIGVMLFSWISIRLGFAKMPQNSSFLEFYGISVLTGVGFTMSLFIDHLAFSDPSLDRPSRLGILSGSLLSGVFGYLVLKYKK